MKATGWKEKRKWKKPIQDYWLKLVLAPKGQVSTWTIRLVKQQRVAKSKSTGEMIQNIILADETKLETRSENFPPPLKKNWKKNPPQWKKKKTII